MPAKRRVISDDEEEDEVLLKKVKQEVSSDSTADSSAAHSTDNTTDNSTTSSSYVWEWEDDGNKWTPFDKKFNDQLDDSFRAGIARTSFSQNSFKFDVLFDRMAQRNAKTFFERRVRVNDGSAEEGGLNSTWQWEDDDGSWKLYDHSAQRLLFAATKCSVANVSYTERKQKYSINLDNKTQENLSTKTKRNIRSSGKAVKATSNVRIAPSKAAAKKEVKGSTEVAPRASTRVRTPAIKDENDDSGKENDDEEEEGSILPKEILVKPPADDKSSIKSVSFTGKAPVDSECFVKDKYHVYSEGADIYDAMLNQTNLKNNNNKFFLMQVLKNNSSNAYAVWLRWGRVGKTGQSNLVQCGANLLKAKEVFCKKFSDKTLNEFEERHDFEKVAGKYDMLLMDYKADTKLDDVDGKTEKTDKVKVESKLDLKLQRLVELICNVQEMEDAVLEMKYDAKKAPLGKLTKEQIKAGYESLKKIESCIRKNNLSGNRLIEACDSFYTRIPHCYGMQRLPLIKTEDQLREKIKLLETLGDIQIALKAMRDEENDRVNPIDQHYAALNTDLRALEHGSEEFRMVDRYTQNTHAATHNQYRMEVSDVFACTRHDTDFLDVGNKVLLWHGSRMTNYVGIMSQGLRIAPPEAPVTGYMFGKGVYFADMSSKSANYCYPTRSKNTGFVLLCEVSLGKTRDLLAADYEADQLPEGFHSTRGLGKIAPDATEDEIITGDVSVPLGHSKETGVVNPDGYTLNYNEFVVYDTRQVKTKYLVQLKFIFK